MLKSQWSRRDFIKFIGGSVLCAPGLRFAFPAYAEGAGNGNKLLVIHLEGALDHLSLRPALGGAYGTLLQQIRPHLLAGQAFLPARDPNFGWHPKAKFFSSIDLSGGLAIVQGVAGNFMSGSHERAQLFLAEGYEPDLTPDHDEPVLTAKGIFGRMGDLRGLSSKQRIGFGGISGFFLRNAKQESIITGGLSNAGLHWAFFGLDNSHSFLSAVDVARYEAQSRGDDQFVQSVSASLQQMNDLRSSLDAYPEFLSSLSPKPRTALVDWENNFSDGLFAFTHLDASLSVITAGNFDSHGAQLESYNKLIDGLDYGLGMFYRNAERLGIMQRTTIVILTEFSRRLVQNANSSTTGTDHGGAFDAYVITHPSRINPGTYGPAPDLDVLRRDYVIPKCTDARQLFATIGADFGVKGSDLYPNRNVSGLPIFRA